MLLVISPEHLELTIYILGDKPVVLEFHSQQVVCCFDVFRGFFVHSLLGSQSQLLFHNLLLALNSKLTSALTETDHLKPVS